MGFRYFIQHYAQRLGLTGRVWNTLGGDVEIEVEGERGSIDELIGWARRGPRSAVVTGVDVQWREYSGRYRGFEITYA